MRRTLLAIVSLVAVGMCTPIVAAAPTGARIIGGADASPASWPFIALLAADATPPDPVNQFCGGSLIDRSWIVTAAHCTFQPSPIDVFVGVTDLGAAAGSQARNVDAVVRHPGYVNDGSFRNDVALLHLDAPVVLGPDAQTIDLVAPTDTAAWDPGSPAHVAGWGTTVAPPAASVFVDALQTLDLPILTSADCANYGSAFVPSMMLCAGFPEGVQDACQGDSGGPLTVAATDSGQRVLVGAVSWGNGCADAGFPGIYAHLPNFRTFVYGTIGVTSPSGPLNGRVALGQASATVSWDAPTTTGGRDITWYEVVARSRGQIRSTTVVPAVPRSTVITGLIPGERYEFSVSASNAAGIGPAAVAVAPPTPTGTPSACCVARVGKTLTANIPAWLDAAGPLEIQWQSCGMTLTDCFDLAGATAGTYRPVDADVGRPIQLIVRASNLAGSTTTTSTPTAPVRETFRLVRTRSSRVIRAKAGEVVVSLGLRTEPRASLSIRVLDHRGRLKRPIRHASRIGGKLPGMRSGRMLGRLDDRLDHNVTVAFPGRARGTVRTVRIVIVATNDEGDTTQRTFRVRVRL